MNFTRMQTQNLHIFNAISSTGNRRTGGGTRNEIRIPEERDHAPEQHAQVQRHQQVIDEIGGDPHRPVAAHEPAQVAPQRGRRVRKATILGERARVEVKSREHRREEELVDR